MATPICADCAAAWSSARLTSGRRRSKSAGMPTITCSGRGWNIAGASQQIIQPPWRHAEQDTEGVFCLGELYVQLRDRRLGSAENILGLIDIAPGNRTVLELDRGELQGRALTRDVVTGDGDLPFVGPDLHVRAGNISDQGHAARHRSWRPRPRRRGRPIRWRGAAYPRNPAPMRPERRIGLTSRYW